MKYFVFILACFFVSADYFSQSTLPVQKRVEIDSVNGWKTTWDSTRIVSKEIKTELFSYKANYRFGERSFIEAQLNLSQFFDTLGLFVDSNLKNTLEVEFPYYEFRIENRIGYSYVFKTKYKRNNFTIFRDCGCGTFKGFRIRGGRFSGYNNQLFEKRINFNLRMKSSYGNTYDYSRIFDYRLDKGIPTRFISYKDSNVLVHKVMFNNGLIDSIKSYYSQGHLMYEAKLENGKLNGDFVYWDEDGNEKLRVHFRENEIQHFYFGEARYEWQEILGMWIQPHTSHK